MSQVGTRGDVLLFSEREAYHERPLDLLTDPLRCSDALCSEHEYR